MIRIFSKHRYEWLTLGGFILPEGESTVESIPDGAKGFLADLIKHGIVQVLDDAPFSAPPSSPVVPVVVVGDEPPFPPSDPLAAGAATADPLAVEDELTSASDDPTTPRRRRKKDE